MDDVGKSTQAEEKTMDKSEWRGLLKQKAL